MARRIARRTLIALSLAGLIVATVFSGVAYVWGQPNLTVEATVLDAGAVKRGAPGHVVFKLTNRGHRSLIATVLRADCQCTVFDKTRMNIAPGGSTTLPVAVDSLLLSEGDNVKHLTLSLNDLAHREVLLSVKLRVQSEFEVSGRAIDFGPVPMGRTDERAATVSVKPGEAVMVMGVTMLGDAFEASGSDDGYVHTVRVRLRPNATAGWHFGTIVVRTSSAAMPELRLPTRALVTVSQD